MRRTRPSSLQKVPTGRFVYDRDGKGGTMDQTVFGRLGHFAVRRRWLVIGIWAIVLVLMGSFATRPPFR